MAKKRGNNEGGIYRRGDGKWVGAVTIGYDERGRQRRRVVYGSTRREAADKLRKLGNEVAEGIVADPGRLTVKDLVKRYLAQKKSEGLRIGTLEGYASKLNRHVVPRIGGVALSRLAPVHVLDLLRSMERAGVPPRTRQNTFDILRRALEFGVRARLLGRNPAEGLTRPRSEAPEVRSLSAQEAKSLLEEARESAEPWVAAAVALGLCGLRRGEVFGLTWRDVDLAAGRVRVRQALTESDAGKRSLGPPKSKSARRDVPIAPWAVRALHAHLESLPAVPHPTRLVFLTAEGTPVRFSNFGRRHFALLVKRAGIEGTTFHQLRHTAATLLLAAGADVKSAQAILGHASAAHTLDVYADAVPDRVDEAMERLGRALDV